MWCINWFIVVSVCNIWFILGISINSYVKFYDYGVWYNISGSICIIFCINSSSSSNVF